MRLRQAPLLFENTNFEQGVEHGMNRFHQWFCQSKFWERMLRNGLPWVLEGVELGDELLEVGPGPGLTTNLLHRQFAAITSVEIDSGFAKSLNERMRSTNVTVLQADATALPFPDKAFSGVVCFTMLHHVPSPQLQDRLLAEVHRVLRPGGVFAGSDSTWSRVFQLMHLFDTMVVVDPSTLGDRLAAAGFIKISVDTIKGGFRFRARRPSA